jgi:sterol desaturase/sphingolipid hydroxylase (fatty acid hydroxylase superfamily)
VKPRDALAWLSFPALLGGFLALAVWGLGRGFDPALWGAALAVLNFAVILAVEQVLPRNASMNVFRDGQSPNDIGHGILVGLSRPLGGAVSVGLLAVLAQARAAASVGELWPAALPFALQMLLAVLLWSFCDYWVHRSLHSFDRLWWFHSIHHDTPQMHILKSGRMHFGEELLNAVLKPVPLLALGAPPEVMVLLGMWTVFTGNLVHSNVDQRFPSWGHYFLPTVQLHNLHHAVDRRHQDSNYSGETPIWDALFGTLSHPERCELGELGIERSPVPARFPDQVLFPFRAQVTPPPSLEEA